MWTPSDPARARPTCPAGRSGAPRRRCRRGNPWRRAAAAAPAPARRRGRGSLGTPAVLRAEVGRPALDLVELVDPAGPALGPLLEQLRAGVPAGRALLVGP